MFYWGRMNSDNLTTSRRTFISKSGVETPPQSVPSYHYIYIYIFIYIFFSHLLLSAADHRSGFQAVEIIGDEDKHSDYSVQKCSQNVDTFISIRLFKTVFT